MCLVDAFFINAMKVNFSPSQITTTFKRTKPKLMRVHSTSLIFTKYLPPIWNSLVLPQHLLTIYLMYKHMFALLQFSYERLWPPKYGQAYLWGMSNIISGVLCFNHVPKPSQTPSKYTMKETAQFGIGNEHCQLTSQNSKHSVVSPKFPVLEFG